MEERRQLILAERQRQEEEEARCFAKVPKVSEKTALMAEMYRLKQNLIDDERFLKKVFDREANAFKVVPNASYHYEKNPIPKREPKHWTFQEAEETQPSNKTLKKDSQTNRESISKPVTRSYTYKLVESPAAKSSRKESEIMNNRSPNPTQTEKNGSRRDFVYPLPSKKTVDQKGSEVSSRLSPNKTPLRSREVSKSLIGIEHDRAATKLNNALTEQYFTLTLERKFRKAKNLTKKGRTHLSSNHQHSNRSRKLPRRNHKP